MRLADVGPLGCPSRAPAPRRTRDPFGERNPERVAYWLARVLAGWREPARWRQGGYDFRCRAFGLGVEDLDELLGLALGYPPTRWAARF